MAIEFNVELFRENFPSFSDPIVYPDTLLLLYFNNATCYISNQNYGYLNGECRLQALNLMTAHLVFISDLIKKNKQPKYVVSSSISKVSISVSPPPNKTDFDWWLNHSTYGILLSSMLEIKSTPGFMAGCYGDNIRGAFR